MQPMQPMQSIQPMQPMQPMQSIQPMQPMQSIQPIQLMQPVVIQYDQYGNQKQTLLFHNDNNENQPTLSQGFCEDYSWLFSEKKNTNKNSEDQLKYTSASSNVEVCENEEYC